MGNVPNSYVKLLVNYDDTNLILNFVNNLGTILEPFMDYTVNVYINNNYVDTVTIQDNEASLPISLKSTDIVSIRSSLTGNELVSYYQFPDDCFFALNNIIQSATEGSTITLNNNYKYYGAFDSGLTDGISINKNLVINGNGFTISGENSATIFKIDRDVNVTLNNIVFKNSSSYRGGAIFNYGTLNVFNSTFVQNAATGADGGAIYNYEGTLNVFNSTFVQNAATGANGGAIYNYEGTLNVFNSTFVQNTATQWGGAIYNEGILNVFNSTFFQNTADYGGAIYNYEGTLTVFNSTFVQNTADDGGAIFNWKGILNVFNSTFINNTADDGGAIANWNTLNVFNSTFFQNTANGEAILNKDTLTVSNSTFTNIVGNGEAINNRGTLTVSNSTFTNIVGNGRAIDNWNMLTITNCTGDNTKIYNYGSLTTATLTILNNETVVGIVGEDYNVTAELVAGGLRVAGSTVSLKVENTTLTTKGNGDGTYWGTYNDQQTGVKTVTATVANVIAPEIKTANIILANNDSFTILNGIIQNAAAESTIILDKDYKYYSEYDTPFKNGITINKTLTINGNGYSISGEKSARIFYINGILNVTLNNIVFNNGSSEGSGGAIYSYDSELTIFNCTFDGNYAVYDGGAIQNNFSKLTLNKCIFVDNVAGKFGGAIETYHTEAIITNCTFEDNYVYYKYGGSGGAIVNYGNELTIFNCTFIDNYANGKGGAIHNSGGQLVVNNTSFIKNDASYGGAISNIYDWGISHAYITNCTFDGNYAVSDGGAIYNYDSIMFINGSIFTNNTLYYDNYEGGAIHTISDGYITKLNVINSLFANNTAGSGGAIFGYATDLFVNNCTFTNNTANDGGAITIEYADANITNSIFNKNYATYGGAIVNYDNSEFELTNCTFIDNTAEHGGAIGNYDNSELELTNCTFIDNTAEHGGAVYNYKSTLTVTDCIGETQTIFNYNGTVTNATLTILGNGTTTIPVGGSVNITAELTAGGLPLVNTTVKFIIDQTEYTANSCKNGTYWYEHTFDTISTVIINGTVSEVNDLEVLTGTIIVDYPEDSFTVLNRLIENSSNEVNLTHNYKYYSEYENEFIKGVLINKNLVINGNGYSIDGMNAARIFNITSGNVFINDIVFKNGNATDGGAIYKFNGELEVNGCTFTNNNVTRSAGAIFNYDDKLTVNNCIFSENAANFAGGAIDNLLGELTITNCTFNQNNATYGGAICNDEGKISIINCTFNQNIAENGGAIYNRGKLTVTKSIFNENNGTFGGAILSLLDNSKLEVTDSIFTNNNALPEAATNNPHGGAIMIETPNATIDNCTFEGNYARSYGGAIYSLALVDVIDTLTITNSKFKENINGVDGGAIFSYKTIKIINCTFDSNYLNGTTAVNGGAVYIKNNNSYVDNCTFNNNRALHYGGALYLDCSNSTVINSKFFNNVAEIGGGAVLLLDDNTIINCLFVNNTGVYGGAIDNYRGNLTINNCNFTENVGNYGEAIYNMATLTVNDCIGDKTQVIYNGGVLTNATLVILNNATVKCDNGNYTNITAVLTAGNLLVVNETVEFIIDEISYSATDCYDGTYYYSYLVDFDGLKNVTGLADNIVNLTVFNGTLTTIGVVLVVPTIEVYHNASGMDYVITLTENNMPLVDKTVTVTIGDKTTDYVTDENGTISLLLDLMPGVYNVSAAYEDFVSNGTITVKPTLFTNNLTMIYKDGSKFDVIVANDEGYAAIGEKVVIHVVGKDYIKVADEYGIASLNINLAAGNYTVITKYNGEEAINTIEVKELIPTLITDDLTKVYLNDTQFIAKLVNQNGGPVVGETVKINICGKDYYKTTNATGEVKLNINLYPGEYLATTTYANLTNLNNVTVTNHIIAEDLVKEYKNASQFEVKVVDDHGQPVAGKSVDITIVGKTYTKVTDQNGIAILNINLAPGTYTVTSKCDKETITNKVTVIEPIRQIITKDLTKYYKNGSQFVVKVLDSKDQPVVGESVTINVLGKDYARTTNATGEAVLNINLAPGEYTIKTTVGKESVTNKVVVLSHIVSSDLVKVYKNDSQFVVKLVDDEGRPLANANLVIGIVGMKDYARTTNATGEAQLNINLGPGTYTIKTTYGTETVTNTVKVLAK